MNTSFSILETICERIRFYMEESVIDGGKYTNDYIVRHLIQPSFVDCLARIHLTTGSPVVLPYDLPLTANIKTYRLPPCIQEVLAVQLIDSIGEPVGILQPRSIFSAEGAGWRLEGTPSHLQLTFDADPLTASALRLIYTTNGDFQPHTGTGALGAVASGTQTLTLPTNATLGLIDRRDSSYLGFPLTLLRAAPAPIQSRTIKRHYFDGTVWKVEVDAFESIDAGSYTYEIVPSGISSLIEAVSTLACTRMGVSRKSSDTTIRNLLTLYQVAIKTAGDNLTNINTPLGKMFVSDGHVATLPTYVPRN